MSKTRIIPPNAELKECTCGAQIFFAKTTNDKWMPMDATAIGYRVETRIGHSGLPQPHADPDGQCFVSHYATCPHANQHSKSKKEQPKPQQASRKPGDLDAREVNMPYGKHQGKTLGTIEDEDLLYLDWLVGTSIKSRILREAVQQICREREHDIDRMLEEREARS